jgi:lipid-A-disaccharide synthase
MPVSRERTLLVPPVRESGSPGILFTAFEPSGDDHASKVISAVKHLRPDIPIYAWGGPKMARAGAAIIERTGDDAVMGMPGFAKIRQHVQINDRIQAWLKHTPIALHVPVDSPAANFPICAITRKAQIGIVHLVAPQIWAWARWRIHKLRRLTDCVLCVLPFEEDFFRKRNVPAHFIGHMLFDEPIDRIALDAAAASLPAGSPRIALMPGSRPAELARNFPMLLDMVRALRADFPGLRGVIACTRPEVESELRKAAAAWATQVGEPISASNWPMDLASVVGQTDTVIHWSDMALVKSGTVTLQVAKHRKPMVIFYRKGSKTSYVLARSFIPTKFFTLPNLIAGEPIVPEFVPHFGGPEPIIAAAKELLADPAARAAQIASLERICSMFSGKDASLLAAEKIIEHYNLRITSS